MKQDMLSRYDWDVMARMLLPENNENCWVANKGYCPSLLKDSAIEIELRDGESITTDSNFANDFNWSLNGQKGLVKEREIVAWRYYQNCKVGRYRG